jgi:hypothetical protein
VSQQHVLERAAVHEDKGDEEPIPIEEVEAGQLADLQLSS